MLNNSSNDIKIQLYTVDRKYDFSIIKITNTKQVGLYVKNNVMPEDMFWNNGTLVYVYNKRETQELYKKWDSQKPKKGD